MSDIDPRRLAHEGGGMTSEDLDKLAAAVEAMTRPETWRGGSGRVAAST